MTVELSHAAQIALASLGSDDRSRVWAWRDHLRNWENDESVRSHARLLSVPGYDNAYLLPASSDLLLFFRLYEDRIEIVDIARHEFVHAFGQAS